MSEYTPTTAEVRGDYKRLAGSDADEATAAAEFDRWLAEVERAAAAKAWTAGARSAEQFYQSHNPGYRKVPLPMPENPYRRNEGENE